MSVKQAVGKFVGLSHRVVVFELGARAREHANGAFLEEGHEPGRVICRDKAIDNHGSSRQRAFLILVGP
jgi:hypothetical protein